MESQQINTTTRTTDSEQINQEEKTQLGNAYHTRINGLKQLNTLQASKEDGPVDLVQQDLQFRLQDALNTIKNFSGVNILNSPRKLSEEHRAKFSDQERQAYDLLHQEDINLNTLQQAIIENRLESFEDFEYVVTRLVTQRTTKLYDFFQLFKSQYETALLMMRDQTQHKILSSLKSKLSREQLEEIRKNQNGRSSIIRVEDPSTQETTSLSRLGLDSLLRILEQLEQN